MRLVLAQSVMTLLNIEFRLCEEEQEISGGEATDLELDVETAFPPTIDAEQPDQENHFMCGLLLS